MAATCLKKLGTQAAKGWKGKWCEKEHLEEHPQLIRLTGQGHDWTLKNSIFEDRKKLANLYEKKEKLQPLNNFRIMSLSV